MSEDIFTTLVIGDNSEMMAQKVTTPFRNNLGDSTKFSNISQNFDQVEMKFLTKVGNRVIIL